MIEPVRNDAFREEDRMLITILIVLAIIALLLFIFRGRFVG